MASNRPASPRRWRSPITRRTSRSAADRCSKPLSRRSKVYAGANAEHPRRLQRARHERAERRAEREAQGSLVERVVDVCTHVEAVLRGGIGEIEIPQRITRL